MKLASNTIPETSSSGVIPTVRATLVVVVTLFVAIKAMVLEWMWCSGQVFFTRRHASSLGSSKMMA